MYTISSRISWLKMFDLCYSEKTSHENRMGFLVNCLTAHFFLVAFLQGKNTTYLPKTCVARQWLRAKQRRPTRNASPSASWPVEPSALAPTSCDWDSVWSRQVTPSLPPLADIFFMNVAFSHEIHCVSCFLGTVPARLWFLKLAWVVSSQLLIISPEDVDRNSMRDV